MPTYVAWFSRRTGGEHDVEEDEVRAPDEEAGNRRPQTAGAAGDCRECGQQRVEADPKGRDQQHQPLALARARRFVQKKYDSIMTNVFAELIALICASVAPTDRTQ